MTQITIYDHETFQVETIEIVVNTGRKVQRETGEKNG